MRISRIFSGSFRFFSFFAILLAVFLSACRPGVKTQPDTLVIGLEAAPVTLDPRIATDAYSSKLSELVHNGLVRLSERLEIIPDLAESYEFIPPLKYKIHLRSGVRFHNGRELTADDVRATLKSVVDPKLASPYRGMMEKVESIDVTGPLDLEINLKEPFAPLLSQLTIGIIPAGGDPSVGTGPFQVERFDPAREVVLKRFDRYFRDGKAKIARLRFRIIPDDNLRVLEVKNGRIDLLQNNVPPPLLAALKDDPGLMIERTAGTNMTYLGMNLRGGPLANMDVREAILRAVDIPSLIEYRMAGLARPATGVLSPVHWAYEGDVATYPYDVAKARELLDRAGYKDPDGDGPRRRLNLTYKTSTKKDRIGLARLIARYLQEVGIEVKVLPYDWGVFFNDVGKGNFQIYSLTWVGVTEPDFYHYAFHSSEKPPHGANRGGYENPAVDKLTEEGRTELDRDKRKKIYSLVQKVLAQDLPIIPLWYEDNYAVYSRRVKGLRLRPNASFEWATEVWKE